MEKYHVIQNANYIYIVMLVCLGLFSGVQIAGATTCSLIEYPLTIHSVGAGVVTLQQRLINDGFSIPAGATGYFGEQTEAALMSWQQQYRIQPAVGYFGPITAEAMTNICGLSSTSNKNQETLAGLRDRMRSGNTSTPATTVTPTATNQPSAVEVMTDGEERWTFIVNGPDDTKDEIDGVAVDYHNDVIVGGGFEGGVRFGTAYKDAGKGSDIWVVKLKEKTGDIDWSTKIDSGADDFLWDLAVDAAGDVYISGGYGGILRIGGKTYEADRDGSVLFAKLDGTDGEITWISTAGVVGESGVIDPALVAGGNEIVIDQQGFPVASINASGKRYQIGNKQYLQSGAMDSFIVKLSPTDGSFVWSYPLTGAGRKQLRAVGVTSDNQVVFGLELIGPMNGTADEVINNTTSQTAQGAVGLLSEQGNLLWLMPVTSEGFANVRGAGGDGSGGVYFTGVITGDAKIDGRPVEGLKNSSTYIARYTSTQTPVWVRVLGNGNGDTGGELTVTDNTVLVSGGNSGRNYHVYDGVSTVPLYEDIFPTIPEIQRNTLVAFTVAGMLSATYEPRATDNSNGGVLDTTSDNCVASQHTMRGDIKYQNGTSYTTKTEQDKDAGLALVCFAN